MSIVASSIQQMFADLQKFQDDEGSGRKPPLIPFSEKQAQSIFKACAFDVIVNGENKGGWCDILEQLAKFEKESDSKSKLHLDRLIELLEFNEDMTHWTKYGYGDKEFNQCLGVPALQGVVKHIKENQEKRAQGNPDTWRGIFGFAHSDTLVLMYTTLVSVGVVLYN
jgi:hypothetical protein